MAVMVIQRGHTVIYPQIAGLAPRSRATTGSDTAACRHHAATTGRIATKKLCWGFSTSRSGSLLLYKGGKTVDPLVIKSPWKRGVRSPW